MYEILMKVVLVVLVMLVEACGDESEIFASVGLISPRICPCGISDKNTDGDGEFNALTMGTMTIGCHEWDVIPK